MGVSFSLCHTQPCGLVTDVTLIATNADMQQAEVDKRNTHFDACSKANCVFIPFAMHTRGTLGVKAEEFIRQSSKAVQPSHQKAFIRDLRQATSTAAAIGRSSAIMAAAERVVW